MDRRLMWPGVAGPGLGRATPQTWQQISNKGKPAVIPAPKMEIRQVRSLDGRLDVLEQLVRAGIRSPIVRAETVWVVSQCPDRNDGCEVGSVFWYAKSNVRYTQDIIGIDTYQTALRTLQFKGGDCLPVDTLLLAEGHRFIPVGALTPGTRIWGLDKWTRVADAWYKGILPVDVVRLNNGSSFRATGNHHVYVARCMRHEVRNSRVAAGVSPTNTPCSCPVADREVLREPVSKLEVGDVLLTPDRVAFGEQRLDPDRAYVEGLYLADGWHDDGGKEHLGAYRFCISGKDGFPKEAQKREVQAVCERLGLPFRWHERYIAVNDREWADRMARMGGHAWEKQALTIGFEEGAAGALLRGIMADSAPTGRGDARCYSTTSRALALQVRVLHKMFGRAMSEKYLAAEQHGGLGRHGLHRLYTRVQARKAGTPEKLLRVAEVVHQAFSVPCYDLTTEDHYVYLPEADVTVSNCDDAAVLLCSMLSAIGFQTGFRVISTTGESWEHIYALVGMPKKDPKGWLPLDITVPSSAPGWEPPAHQVKARKDRAPLRLT